MAKSRHTFNRWKNFDPTTWPYQLFKQYDKELLFITESFRISKKYTYRKLGESKANIKDPTENHFGKNLFDNIEMWSQNFNDFANWINLSKTLTLAANLETYMASVVSLALESNPGVLLGASQSIDGAAVLKHGKSKSIHIKERIERCTKGDWSARLDAFEDTFSGIPQNLREAHSILEEIRKTRNNFGHAFGRDIDIARMHGTLNITPIQNLSEHRTEKFRKAIINSAKEIDDYLLKHHIGDYEAVSFYHKMYPDLNKTVPYQQRAIFLKKKIGHLGAGLRGKIYCNGLVKYWEDI